MLTILEKSEQGRGLNSFRTLRWLSSNNLSNSSTKTFWQVNSKQRKFTVIEFLKQKYFFQGLSMFQQRCLFDAPGVLSDELFVSAMIAKQSVDPKVLLQRLNFLQRLTYSPEWNWNRFFTLEGIVSFQMFECRQAIRPAAKYSGYVRNSSAVGSKKGNKLFIPEPEIFEWNNNVKIDFLEFLTVGELATGTPGGFFFTPMRTKSSKRFPEKQILNDDIKNRPF